MDAAFLDLSEDVLFPYGVPALEDTVHFLPNYMPAPEKPRATRHRDLLLRLIHIRDHGCDVDGTVWRDIHPDEVIEGINTLESVLRPRNLLVSLRSARATTGER